MKYIKRYVLEFVIFFIIMIIVNQVLQYNRSIVTLLEWSVGVVVIFAISDYIKVRRDKMSKL